jgi:hypothetical protein
MRDDADFGRRLAKKTQEIKEDKQHLAAIASDYSSKYSQEIKEGTELRQKLLSEGTRRGLSEDEVMQQYNRFIPTVHTPILNLLHFMLRESEDDTHYGKRHYERRDQINESLIKDGHVDIKETYTNSNLNELTEDEAERILNEFVDEQFAPATNPVRKQLNATMNESIIEEENGSIKEPEKMESYLYGNLNLDQFEVLKKLKSLTLSDNVAESTLAFKKCKELCIKYGLKYEMIPCYYKKKEI